MAQNPSEDGFSLVELLVIVIILGVLAAIAMPTFLGVRNRSYASKMQTDLHHAILAEAAFNADNDAFTATVSDLVAEGYRASSGVTPVHVKLTGSGYLACVKHTNVQTWLVYDSTTSTTTPSS